MTWESRRKQLEAAIGDRELIWLGIRGSDAQSLLALRQFRQCHSLTTPLNALSLRRESCLESIAHRRVDLDNYILYLDSSPKASEFIDGMYSAIDEPSVVVPYRPTSIFSSIRFVRRGIVTYLGLFDETQAQFEHKPWVESELRSQGIPTIPWKYHLGKDLKSVSQGISDGPLVLRMSKTAGGTGLLLARSQRDLARWPRPRAGDYFATAPYLSPSIPLNVGGCVFPGGDVRLHSPSLQLIGVPICTNRELGYCGNDFGAVKDLPDGVLDALDNMARGVGRWLGAHGYIGAFGVDALVYRGTVLLAEVNPRFQGSSALSARLERARDRSDIFMDHIAAFMGLPPEEDEPLTLQGRHQKSMFHCVLHNVTSRPVTTRGGPARPGPLEVIGLPSQQIRVDPGGMLCRAIGRGRVTDTGTSLVDKAEIWLSTLRADMGV